MTQIFTEYTRVTDALYPFSGLATINLEVLRIAADRGTRVHEACQAIIDGCDILPDEEDLKGYIQSFRQWYPKNFISKIPRLYCDTYMITGEVDGVYEDNGDLVLVDFKTPQSESKSWQLQLSAYAYLARKNGHKIDRIEVLKLSKEGRKPKTYIYEEDFAGYVECLNVYRRFYKNNPQEEYLRNL